MELIILVVHLMVAVALVGIVLIQRSEGGGLGIGGSSGGLMTTRGTSNLLTKITAGLAATFMLTNLVLAWIAGGSGARSSILDKIAPTTTSIPALADPQPAPAPIAPSGPAAPLR